MKKLSKILIITFLLVSSIGLVVFFYFPQFNHTINVVYIEGDTHYELGLDYGKKCKAQIQYANTILSEDLIEIDFDELEKYIPDKYIEEMEGVAEGAGVSYEFILWMNAFYDLAFSSGGACTCFVKAENTADDCGPILMSNLDMTAQAFLQSTNIFVVANFKGRRWIGQAFFGMIGFAAMVNDEGLAIAENTVSSDENDYGYPHLLAIRQAIDECSNVTEAVNFLTGVNHTAGWNFVLTDKTGQAAAVEDTSKRSHVRLPGTDDEHNNYMITTNHFRSDEMREYGPSKKNYENSYIRFSRAEHLLATSSDDFTVYDAIQIARDTYDENLGATHPEGGDTICRKGNLRSPLKSGTVNSFIALPKQEYATFCIGHPDVGHFYAINFKGEIKGPIA